jgi:quinol monooxygenase YgiN
MILGTLRILPLPNRRSEALEILRSVQGPVLAQPGCVACDIYDEQGSEPAIVLLERWDSDDALASHLRSDLYRRVLAAVELSGSQPDFRFEHVSSSEGIELVERLRRPGGPPVVD